MSAARLQVLLAALCFATTGTAQSLGPGGIAPVDVGAARILVGGALLVLVARFVRDPAAPRPGHRAAGGSGHRAAGRSWPVGVVALAAAGVAVYQLCFFAAVADTGVAVGTIVALGSAPALTGALEWAVARRRPGGRWAAATAPACAGVALLVLAGGGGQAGVSAGGVVLAVGAGAAYATYTLAAKRLLGDGHAPEHVMARAFGLGALLLVPVLVAGAPAALLRPGGIALALFLGVVPTALAYVLFARGLRRLSAAETSTLTLAEPLTAGLLGAMVLSERLTAASALGAGLVLAGLVVLAWPGPRPRATPAMEPA